MWRWYYTTMMFIIAIAHEINRSHSHSGNNILYTYTIYYLVLKALMQQVVVSDPNTHRRDGRTENLKSQLNPLTKFIIIASHFKLKADKQAKRHFKTDRRHYSGVKSTKKSLANWVHISSAVYKKEIYLLYKHFIFLFPFLILDACKNFFKRKLTLYFLRHCYCCCFISSYHSHVYVHGTWF